MVGLAAVHPVPARELGESPVAGVDEHGRSPRGGAEGRGIVMGCDEPLARGGGVVERVGAVWFGADRACRWAFRGAQVCCWWAGGRARLSRSCHKWRETWWDAGGYVETICAGRWEGRDKLGRVNTASL